MRKTSIRLAFTAMIVLSLLWQPSALKADDDDDAFEVFSFHSPIPLGLDCIRVMPSKKTVYFLASAENQTLDGLKISREPHVARVVRVDGSEVKSYPSALDFRVTATALPTDFKGIEEYEVQSNHPMNEFLLGLKFKLKIFRGLQMKTVNPSNVKLIGVPSYEPYDERVYRVSFETPDLPVDARLVLEVFDSTGTRLTRFHLEIL